MIKNTFIFIPGIGEKTEEAFRKKGILTWDDFQKKSSILNLSVSKKKNIGDCLDKAKEALESKPVFSFFAANLPQKEHWRIYKEAGNKVLFLDIETTGLSLYYNKITLIGTFDGHKVKVFIRENNLEEFLTYILNYDIIVTFNGKLFDVPFIKKEFPEAKIPPIHIDLRYLLRSLGITGPLKKIEEQLGVRRPEELKEINGRIATILWSRFKKGDDQALEKLVLYNIYDVVNLQAIMHLCYQQKVKELKRKINSEKINHKMALSKLEACPANQTEHFTLFDDLPSFNVSKIITRYSHDRVMEAYLNDELLFKINRSKIKSMGLKIEVLIQKIKNKNCLPRVVGIDLSGSEERDSGFCVLDREKAFLDLVKTDEEIILKTINAEPAVISIDSPLGLPKGRCCPDDFCACRKYGITRECERALKKRGINVYPCLIKSMQKLTVRGIKLANYFREIGYEVIESYPGAAQDILGIPRKRIDLPELETDLRDIGIKPCVNKSEAITHDEIDALVCALVGFFYLAESYEALGNEEEGYLSLPVFENKG